MKTEKPPTFSSLLNIATGFYVGVHYDAPFFGVCLMFVLLFIELMCDAHWDFSAFDND